MNYTKTEWKDLPDTTTPITASRLNNIEDGVEYLFDHGSNIYSSNEIKVGTWINNKPIYRKVISATLNSDAVTNYYSQTVASNVAVITHQEGNLDFENGGYIPITHALVSGSSIYYMNSEVNVDSSHDATLEIYTNNPSYNSTPFYYVIEYTKTTD